MLAVNPSPGRGLYIDFLYALSGSPEGGDSMQTFEQILLLGGAVGSLVGGIFSVLSYLKNDKKKK